MRLRLALCLLVLLAPAITWAGPYEIFGTGPRAIAMGGAYAALGDDVAGLYYNLAAITQVTRFHLELGYTYATPYMRIDGAREDVDQNKGYAIGGIVSTTIKGHRLSGGVNAFIPQSYLMRFLMFTSNQPHSPLVANANQRIVALTGLAFEVFPWLSVGGGLNMLANNHGGVDFLVNEHTPSEGSLHSNISGVFAPIAGLWSQPTDWLRVGVSYREKLVCRLVLPNDVSIPPVTAFPGSNVAILPASHLTLSADAWSHFTPRQFELGVAFEPYDWLTVSVDLTYMEWSEMKSDMPAASIVLTGGLADIVPTINGPQPPPATFRDTFNPAIGIEGRPLDDPDLSLALRLGYRYRPTPVPNQTGVNNYLDSDTHIFSGGFGLTFGPFWDIFPQPLSLDAFVQYHWMTPRTTHKTDPTDVMGDYQFAGQWWNFGGSMTFRF
jgi:long-subunit fatty acid transport protein